MKISIIGGGSWGTAMALHLSELNVEVSVWEYDKDRVEYINKHRINDLLPKKRIPDSINYSNKISDILIDPEIIVMAIPSSYMREVSKKIGKQKVSTNPIIVNLSKGIEEKTHKRMSEVISETIKFKYQGIVALSGPSHAEEVSENLPTLLVAASDNVKIAKTVQAVFMTERLRIYYSKDIIGVEYGGALKNVIAIAAGICKGVGFGDNAIAALIIRGASEIMKISEKMGADPMTIAGLSGIGDLIVTATSHHSRNQFVGIQIGKGKILREVLASMKMVAEGVITAKSAHQLSIDNNIEMPIINAMYKVLYEDMDPLETVDMLMTRDSKEE
ncbi:MAG: NAD(P)H-dependent glycerol-3-phosphate dehydrogenase [Candidatus Marinimicrobia bacterium]|nr:NAD(P)H-dependent glycerol-3-phosphate dehydrogenase [Candidatus Neomarinimicrobiota bacterium]